MDNGRCRMHGGKSTGPPVGNQNARTHGGYSVLADALTDDERALWDLVVTDPTAALDNEIRLLEVRQRRVLVFLRDKLDGAVTTGLEDALTRLSSAKLRAVEAKIRAQSDRLDDGGELDALFAAIGGPDDYEHARPDA